MGRKKETALTRAVHEFLAAFIRDASKMLEQSRYEMTVAQVGNVTCALIVGAVWALADARSAALYALYYLSATTVSYFALWAWKRWRR